LPDSSPTRRTAALLGLLTACAALILFLPPPTRGQDPYEAAEVVLHQRSGDTYLRLYALTRSRDLLERAAAHYLLAQERGADDLQTSTSLAVALHETGQEARARRQLADAALRARLRDQEHLKAVLRLLMPRPAARDEIASVRPLVADLPAGWLALASAYARIGEVDLAERERAAARDQALALVPRLVAMLSICGALLLLGLVYLALGLLRLFARRLQPPQGAPLPPWGLRAALEALLLAAAANLALHALLLRLLGERADAAPVVILPTLASLGAAIAWLSFVSGRPLQLGWNLRHPGRQLLAGVAAAGLAALPLLLLHQYLQDLAGPYRKVHALTHLFVLETGVPNRVWLALAACLIVPAVEETLFRRLLYGSLRRRWSVLPAAALSSSVFAALHLSLPGFLPYLAIGLLLCCLYERYASLLAPAAAHGALNAFSLAILLPLLT